jgi:CBS domain-containing protein
MEMVTHRVSHLVLVHKDDASQTPRAVLTAQDVAHFRGKDPLATVHRIDHIVSVDELSSIREETSEQIQSLQEQGVPPERLTHLLASLYDRVAQRVLELVEADLREENALPRADLSWAWVRVGSGGRQEMVLTSEQQNALLYADPDDDAQAARAEAWFAELGRRVTAALETCGFPPSELVAGAPEYCMCLSAWKRQFRTWIFEADDQTIPEAMRFFDLRGIYGEQALVDELVEDVEDALNVQALDTERHVLQMLAAHALKPRAALTLFERLKLPRTRDGADTYDLRERGILPVVEAARVLALDLRYFASSNTFDRLRHAANVLPELHTTLEMAREGYRHLADLRLEHQLYLVEGGEPPDDDLDVYSLTKMQQRLLQRAADAVADLQDVLAERYNLRRKG